MTTTFTRTIRQALLAASMLIPAMAAHAADPDTSKAIKVAMVPKLIGLSVFKANEKGAEQAAKNLNINFLYTGPVTASAQGQVDVFNSLIARRFNVITTTSNNPTQLAPALRRAMKQGIKGRLLRQRRLAQRTRLLHPEHRLCRVRQGAGRGCRQIHRTRRADRDPVIDAGRHDPERVDQCAQGLHDQPTIPR